MADGSRVVVTGRRLLSPFRTLLQRLSLEIEEDQFKSMKFMLQDCIPLGILETFHKPRDLFSFMLQKCLLGEDNLDLLRELLIQAQRSDLAERVKESTSLTDGVVDASGEQMNRELPVMGKAIVYFMLSGKVADFNQKGMLERLKLGISAALKVKGYEIFFVRREEIMSSSCRFSVIFQIPDKAVDTLRQDALHKEDWLQQCGIEAVKIGEDAFIFLVQPITRPPSTTVATQTRTSYPDQPASGVAEMPCTNFVNVKNLDLIVVVERNLNTYLQKKLNTQLAHMVNMICEKKFDFRLALVCYKDHTTSPLPNAHTQWFTKDKDDMKTRIRGLQPSETVGFSHGLADGLDLALKLAINSGGDDLMCRKDASKVCILLPLLYKTTSLGIYNCAHGHDVMKICRQLAENAVTLYTVGISHSGPASLFGKNPLADFFAGISLKTGGRHIQTPDIRQLPGMVMCAIEEDVSLERLIGTAHDIVLEEVTKKYQDVNVEELSEKLKAALINRSCHADLMLINGVNIPSESELAQKLSYDEDFDSACVTFEQGVNRMQQSVAAAAGIPRDINMEATSSMVVSISNHHEITSDLSERLVRKVGHRSTYST